MAEEIEYLSKENKGLKTEIEHLQNLNFGYVKQINVSKHSFAAFEFC